jgi:hypothetical protein
MTCNCKKELEALLLSQFKEKHPEAEAHEVSIGGFKYVLRGGIVGSGHLDVKSSLPVEMEAMFPVKKTGGLKPRKIKSFMVANFCPFCGVAYEGGAVAGDPKGEVAAQRDTAREELARIRQIIGANPEESTADEVERITAQRDKMLDELRKVQIGLPDWDRSAAQFAIDAAIASVKGGA